MDERTDEQLLEAFGRRDDRAAFAELFRRHGRALYGLTWHVLGDAHDAEDAVQEVFVELLRAARDYRPGAPARAWLHRVALNTALDAARKRRRRAAREETGGLLMAQERGTADSEAGLLSETVRTAVARLPENFRLPIVLHYFQGLSAEEAAEVLGRPRGTVLSDLHRGRERLKAEMAGLGGALAALPVAGLEGALQSVPLPQMPAALAARIEGLIGSHVAATTTAAAKGGIAMKILAGVVVAGVLAGAVAVVGNLGGVGAQHAAPLQSPPAAGTPAPVNEYKGMQDREEVFEFAEKPAVKKDGNKWVITFASKGKCDATVSILDKDGKVIRRLASGVLGKNAPWPFQQDSLAQKLEWDGQTDTRKPAPAGCKVKVGLGLQAKFERNIWDVNHTGPKGYPVVLGTGKDGEMYVGSIHAKNSWGRVYAKDGKYLRTFWPPAAADLEKAMAAMGGKIVPTAWGDKVPIASAELWAPGSNTTEWVERAKDLAAGLAHKENGGVQTLAKVMEKVYGLDPAKLERAPRPAAIPAEKPWAQHIANIFSKVSHLDVDPETEQLYAGSWTLFRFDGKTGEFDEKWFPKGELSMCEYAVAPEGLIYVRTGPYGKLMVRLDREGKLVPFKENTVVPNWPKAPWGWKPKFLPEGSSGIDVGMAGFSATQQNGFHVSADGATIVTCLREFDKQWGLDQKLPINLKSDWYRDTFVSVYTPDGKLISPNLAGEIRCGNGIGIDREGNFYSAFASLMPGGQKRLDGYVQDFPGNRITSGHGSLVKLRGLSGKYPVGGLGASGEGAPLKVSLGDYSGPGQLKDAEIGGGLWAYGGLTCQSNRGCSCGHARIFLDRAARVFVPTNHLYSIMVLDSNGNRIARFGRYGNVDDNDPKYGGIHLCWPRAVCASDTAMYVTDYGNERILKAALSYAAEETVPASPN